MEAETTFDLAKAIVYKQFEDGDLWARFDFMYFESPERVKVEIDKKEDSEKYELVKQVPLSPQERRDFERSLIAYSKELTPEYRKKETAKLEEAAAQRELDKMGKSHISLQDSAVGKVEYHIHIEGGRAKEEKPAEKLKKEKKPEVKPKAEAEPRTVTYTPWSTYHGHGN